MHYHILEHDFFCKFSSKTKIKPTIWSHINHVRLRIHDHHSPPIERLFNGRRMFLQEGHKRFTVISYKQYNTKVLSMIFKKLCRLVTVPIRLIFRRIQNPVDWQGNQTSQTRFNGDKYWYDAFPETSCEFNRYFRFIYSIYALRCNDF